MVYTVQYVELESVGGNVYFNTVFCSILEISSGFVGSVLAKRYRSEDVFKVTLVAQAAVYYVFLFAPSSISEIKGGTMLFFVGCLLFAKICNDLLNLMIYFQLPKLFPEKYIGIFLISSRAMARIFMTAMPTMNYVMKSLGAHPFVFYGIVFSLYYFLLKYAGSVEDDSLDQFMNDVQVPITQRISICSASHSVIGSGHFNHVLSKFHHGEISLKSLRRNKQYGIYSEQVLFRRKGVETPLKLDFEMPRSEQLIYQLKEYSAKNPFDKGGYI